MKLSDCCGAAPKGNGDCDTSDFGICSDCKEHCEYIESCDECGEEIEECVCENENFNDHPDNLIALDALYNKTKGQSERTPKITSETDADDLFKTK